MPVMMTEGSKDEDESKGGLWSSRRRLTAHREELIETRDKDGVENT